MEELGGKDQQVADFVQNSNAVFSILAGQDANLRESLRLLPGALDETRPRWPRSTGSRSVLGPTLEDLRPGARALGPALRETRPFLRETTPILRDQIRPFARAALPTVKQLRPGDERPGRRHAEPDALVQGHQRAAQHARLQPARGPRGGLPVLALVGATTPA